MPTITYRQINIATKSLESVIKQAKRKLFEYETLTSLYDIQQGNFKKYKS